MLGGNYYNATSPAPTDALFWSGYKVPLIRKAGDEYTCTSYPEPYGGNTLQTCYSYGFGSWHPGISLFVLGDASVRSVDTQVGTGLLSALGGKRDGQQYMTN